MSQLHARICQYTQKQYSLPIDMCTYKNRYSKQNRGNDEKAMIEIIIFEVCTARNVTPELLKIKTRIRGIVLARQEAMYLLRKYTKLALLDIGELFGGYCHTTVWHSCTTVKEQASVDKDYANELTQLETKIKYML